MGYFFLQIFTEKQMNFEDDGSCITDEQLQYFKNKLLQQKQEILAKQHNESGEQSSKEIEFFDVVGSQIARSIEIKEQERQWKILQGIEKALERIKDGSYGYCEETGEFIGLRRLEANPLATLSVEAQHLHEKRKKLRI